MNIPKSFNDFTVDQFQKWHEIIDTEHDVLRREYSLLAMLLGISVEDCEAITFKKLDPLFKQINSYDEIKPSKKLKQVIIVKRKPYVAIVNLKELRHLLTANQFTAAQTYAATPQSTVQNMHRLLSLVYCPYRFMKGNKLSNNTELTAEKMKLAKIGDVYGTVFFYSIVYKKLQETSSIYFHKAQKILMERMNEIAEAHGLNSQGLTDGITQ